MSAVMLMLALNAALPADSARYKVEVAYSQNTAVGSQEIHLTGFLTLFQRDTTGGKVAQFRLDSLRTGATPIDGTSGISYRGMIVDGAVAGGFQISSPHPQAKMLTQGLDNVFPGIRPTHKVGDVWSDTVRLQAKAPVVQDRTTILDWRIVSLNGAEIVAEAATRGTMVVKQAVAAGERVDEVSMTGTRHIAGPVNGPMTSAIVASEQEQLTTLPGIDPIPGTIKTSTTITRLP